ncbi:MAG: type 4a pilus biogenesis protein PilO [Phycisphaerales bacterium]|nr:type 4a pilus biogenesis protein PilO [Phycisphaerales bacterium]
MLTNKKPIYVALGVMVLFGLGIGTLAWPNYSKLREVNADIDKLSLQIETSAQHAQEIEEMRVQLADSLGIIETDFKRIPDAADIEELIRRLSLPVDQQTVLDQTFTAREAFPALDSEEPTKLLAKPLDIEIRAVFDSVFAVVQAVESLDQLTRITAIHMAAEERASGAESPVLTASINVEAIFSSQLEEEGK